MNKYWRLPQILIIILLMLFSASCASDPVAPTKSNENNSNGGGMANPAAVYCEGLGYTMEDVQREGGIDSDCVFPDGERCEQWDFLAGRCGQEYTYCEMNGGTVEEGDNILTCRFPDRSTCDEYQYFQGECMEGDNP